MWKADFSTTIYFIGVVIGSVTYGSLADRFGRHKCIVSCYICIVMFRLFLGFFIQGMQNVCFVMLMEYAASKYRELIGGLENVVAIFGVALLSYTVYLFGNWRDIQLCIANYNCLIESSFCSGEFTIANGPWSD